MDRLQVEGKRFSQRSYLNTAWSNGNEVHQTAVVREVETELSTAMSCRFFARVIYEDRCVHSAKVVHNRRHFDERSIRVPLVRVSCRMV